MLQRPEQRIVGNGEQGRGVHLSWARRQELAMAAREYLSMGWKPVPIPWGSKGPVLANWQNLRVISETIRSAFLGAGNIGILLGQPSGELVDVDLDCPEARSLAGQFLPATEAVTGRPNSPRSHWWYISPGVETARYRDPISEASIVELRGTGAQTLVGPSIHPSGEAYDWLTGEPALVASTVLVEAVGRLAREVIRLRHGDAALDVATPKPVMRTGVAPPGDRKRLLRRASAYLGAIPPAISGQGGHKVTFTAAVALVHGFGLNQEEALQTLLRDYNPRCQPAWSESELRHKVTDALERPHRRPFGWLIGEGMK